MLPDDIDRKETEVATGMGLGPLRISRKLGDQEFKRTKGDGGIDGDHDHNTNMKSPI